MANVVSLHPNGQPTKAQSIPTRLKRPNKISHSATDKAYLFTEGKDPLLLQLINLIDESGFTVNYISEKSGVAAGTIHNWIAGKTRRPQNVTMESVLNAIGYERKVVRQQGVIRSIRSNFKDWKALREERKAKRQARA